MKAIGVALTVLVVSVSIAAQQEKPVPKDSARVTIPGCSKGVIFTAGPRTEDQPGRPSEIREGLHLRMNAPKKMREEIKAHEGSMIEITGLIKKGQYLEEGVKVGGVRVTPGVSPTGGPQNFSSGQIAIDLEGWRPIVGDCASR